MPALLNDQIDDQLVLERQESFAGGEDNYRRSTLIDPDQCQKLVNIIVRDNYEAWTRPGADSFSTDVMGGNLLLDSGTAIETDDGATITSDDIADGTAGPIRTLKYFDTPGNKWLLACCSGKLRACSGYQVAWQQINGSYTAAATDIRVEIAQGVDTCLVSDGVNAMATLDSGLTLTTCGTGVHDPPVGANILCWHAGRMFASGFSDENDRVNVSNLLEFGDGQWNPTAGSFRVGNGDGDPITALKSLQDFTLAVFKANSVYLVQTNPAGGITDWSAQDLGQLLGFGVGCVGKRALASVGNDVFFMAQDGVRTLRRMAAAAGQWEVSAPLSQPVQQYINRINRAAIDKVEAIAYQEFVLFAIPLDSSTTNNATLVFNTRLGRWIGLWTGWEVTCWCKTRFSNREQLLFGDVDAMVNYWKDASDTNNASTYLDNSNPITGQQLWTRAFLFGDPYVNKSAYNCEIRFTAGQATMRITAMLDLGAARTFSHTVSPAGDVLGIGRLGSFRLASVTPVKVRQSLRSLVQFNELYLKIEADAGWFKLRNITLAAFPKAFEG